MNDQYMADFMALCTPENLSNSTEQEGECQNTDTIAFSTFLPLESPLEFDDSDLALWEIDANSTVIAGE